MRDRAPTMPYVELTDTALIYHQPDTAPRTVRWDNLHAVLIETTDQGPFAEDVWWVLIYKDEDGEGHCMIAQEVGGEALLARLQALPNFDNEAVIAAMMSVENKLFTCWQRKIE